MPISLLTQLCESQAVCSWITCDTIERCRLSCGGHGYSLLSGLPSIYASYVQNATWEGDNNVLCLQARASQKFVVHGFCICLPSSAGFSGAFGEDNVVIHPAL